MWVGGGCWYFAEVLVWYLTTHRDLSKIVLLVETCQISRDQTNISQKHQEFQNEKFPLNIPRYMRRRGCWSWHIRVLWGARAGVELSFERKRISLTGGQLISREIIWQCETISSEEESWPGGRGMRDSQISHVELWRHIILAWPGLLLALHKSDRTIRRVTQPLSVIARLGKEVRERGEMLHWAGISLWGPSN